MYDKCNIELSEKEKIEEALGHLAEALCWAFETESDVGHALAFMIDAALKYGQVVLRDDDVLSASADYTAYEQKVYEEHVKRKRLKKMR